MLRSDFPDIFDYITTKSVHYRLNTNGTLITPSIAKLLTRRGLKMVALYGATAEVHDHITRQSGSFEDTLRGMAYLDEAGATFTVQVIPMRDNYHQYAQMLDLASSLSASYRVGAAWLHPSACGPTVRNEEIMRQRLDPGDVMQLDPPSPIQGLLKALDGASAAEPSCGRVDDKDDDRLFASCIADRRDFHVDPYGGMSFCCFVKDSALRYDLPQGSFREAWEEFVPALADRVHGGKEYREHCGSCDLREHCHWCGVHSYLEHGRYSAKVEYLCRVAQETQRFKDEWMASNLRYYDIGGITLQITTDFPLRDNTFAPKFDKFRADGPGEDTVSIHHFSTIPSKSELNLGQEVYNKPPWTIYRQRDSWAYLGTSPLVGEDLYGLAIFSLDHRRGTIYRDKDYWDQGESEALTTFASDQVLLARLLADREGCYLHSSGIVIDGRGFLFVGHSEAGKSTMLKMLRDHGEILCDDRMIVRRWPDGFRIHGTWSHGELPDVSPAEAPLQAIMFLDKADSTDLVPIDDKLDRLAGILEHTIKPLVTADWWEKTLDLAEKMVAEVPMYRLRFDLSGDVVDTIRRL